MEKTNIINNTYKEKYLKRLLSHSNSTESNWYINGWGSRNSQLSRYSSICNFLPDKKISLLDVGCGTGDFFSFIKEKHLPYEYTGIDLIPEMVEYAITQHQENCFFVEDVYQKKIKNQHYDFIVVSGLFQYNNIQNREYYADIFNYLLRTSRKGVVANFLSNLRDEDFKASNELYLEPSEVVNSISKICNYFSLDHSYHRRYADFTMVAFK